MRMMQKKIQIFLFIVGILLILITYFYFPYKNKSLVEKNIQENIPAISDNLTEKSTSFENIEYQGFYDMDKTFVVKSEKGYIEEKEPDIVYMTNMHVVLYLNDGRVVNILSENFGQNFSRSRKN